MFNSVTNILVVNKSFSSGFPEDSLYCGGYVIGARLSSTNTNERGLDVMGLLLH